MKVLAIICVLNTIFLLGHGGAYNKQRSSSRIASNKQHDSQGDRTERHMRKERVSNIEPRPTGGASEHVYRHNIYDDGEHFTGLLTPHYHRDRHTAREGDPDVDSGHETNICDHYHHHHHHHHDDHDKGSESRTKDEINRHSNHKDTSNKSKNKKIHKEHHPHANIGKKRVNDDIFTSTYDHYKERNMENFPPKSQLEHQIKPDHEHAGAEEVGPVQFDNEKYREQTQVNDYVINGKRKPKKPPLPYSSHSHKSHITHTPNSNKKPFYSNRNVNTYDKRTHPVSKSRTEKHNVEEHPDVGHWIKEGSNKPLNRESTDAAKYYEKEDEEDDKYDPDEVDEDNDKPISEESTARDEVSDDNEENEDDHESNIDDQSKYKGYSRNYKHKPDPTYEDTKFVPSPRDYSRQEEVHNGDESKLNRKNDHISSEVYMKDGNVPKQHHPNRNDRYLMEQGHKEMDKIIVHRFESPNKEFSHDFPVHERSHKHPTSDQSSQEEHEDDEQAHASDRDTYNHNNNYNHGERYVPHKPNFGSESNSDVHNVKYKHLSHDGSHDRSQFDYTNRDNQYKEKNKSNSGSKSNTDVQHVKDRHEPIHKYHDKTHVYATSTNNYHNGKDDSYIPHRKSPSATDNSFNKEYATPINQNEHYNAKENYKNGNEDSKYHRDDGVESKYNYEQKLKPNPKPQSNNNIQVAHYHPRANTRKNCHCNKTHIVVTTSKKEQRGIEHSTEKPSTHKQIYTKGNEQKQVQHHTKHAPEETLKKEQEHQPQITPQTQTHKTDLSKIQYDKTDDDNGDGDNEHNNDEVADDHGDDDSDEHGDYLHYHSSHPDIRHTHGLHDHYHHDYDHIHDFHDRYGGYKFGADNSDDYRTYVHKPRIGGYGQKWLFWKSW